VQSGGEARLLNNGDGFLPVMLDDIANARRTINFMVYIWEPGEMSKRIATALAARARDGIEVRVLLDGLGGIRAPDEDIDLMKSAGALVQRFRPPSFGRLTRFHKRNHRRAIVMDGRIAYTGGAAVGEKWLGNADSPDHWRDIMVRATGSMAADLQSAFAELWAHCCGEMLVGRDFYPVEESAGDGALHFAGDADARDASTPPRHISLISSPSSDEHPVRLFFNLAFLAARERLWITTPYFVPDKGTRLNIAERAKAGVDVRLLLPNEYTDAKPIRWAAHGFYAKLLEQGVRIWEYQPTMLHSKAIVIDSAWSIVGSANLDIRSKELNEENLLGIQHRPFAEQLEEAFLDDLESAQEIKLEEWKRRGVVARGLERAAAIFSEQY
jgi:cardiolipin synthase